jgi:HAD superfamily hydrolase (TIGR01509 family)
LTIRAVLFDLGNTLIKYDVGSPNETFRRVLASLGISRSIKDIENATLKAEQEARDFSLLSSYGKMKLQEYWNKWNSLVLKHLNIADREELASFVHSMWFDHVDCTPYPEVEEILSKLAQMGLKVGLITTAYEEEIDLILDKAKLTKKTFDIVVGADTIKQVKPHADVFRYALKMLKVKAKETIFVGDSIDADYKGAENAGLQAVLLARRGNSQENGFKTIKNLKEIVAYIG